VAKVVEHLPSKLEAMCSIPSGHGGGGAYSTKYSQVVINFSSVKKNFSSVYSY
jgi:hypothetical protein